MTFYGKLLQFFGMLCKKNISTLVVILAPPRANNYDGDFPQKLFDLIFSSDIFETKLHSW